MKKLTLIGILVLALIFTTSAFAQRVGGGKHGVDVWEIMTYGPENDYTVPISYPVTKSGGGVAFDLYIHSGSPDRAMLVVDDLTEIKGFHGGNLTGEALSAKIAIEAKPGTTFMSFNNDGNGTLPGNKWADPGGFVRLYFNKVGTTGCPDGWHPERPDCEAQYWWSNPLHIDLQDLAALGKKGIKLEVPLDPAFWSDRDGDMGDTGPGDVCWGAVPADCMYVDHSAAFAEAVANVKKIGLSFGGNGWWAFGVGASAPGAMFKLNSFEVKKVHYK